MPGLWHAGHHIASNMNELAHERSRIHANTVINALESHNIWRNMNELAQERSRIHANTVKSALTS